MDTQELISQARDLSGESTRGTRPKFPSIKFMGRASKYGEAGKYYLLTQKDGELESKEIGTTLEITILRMRKVLDNNLDGDKRKFVYEFDSTNPNAEVYLKIGKQEVMTTQYKHVRDDNPDLKYIEVLYVIYNKQLCKLKVSGGSLSNLFKYLQTIPYNDTVMRYKTILANEEITHEKGNYFAITFAKGEVDPDFEKYITTIKQIPFQQAPVMSLPPSIPEDTQEDLTNKEIEINVDEFFPS